MKISKNGEIEEREQPKKVVQENKEVKELEVQEDVLIRLELLSDKEKWENLMKVLVKLSDEERNRQESILKAAITLFDHREVISQASPEGRQRMQIFWVTYAEPILKKLGVVV